MLIFQTFSVGGGGCGVGGRMSARGSVMNTVTSHRGGDPPVFLSHLLLPLTRLQKEHFTRLDRGWGDGANQLCHALNITQEFMQKNKGYSYTDYFLLCKQPLVTD